MPRTRDTPVREVVRKPGYQHAVSPAIPPPLFDKCDAFYYGALRFPDPSVTTGRPRGRSRGQGRRAAPSPVVRGSTGQWTQTPESSNVLGTPFTQWLPVAIAPEGRK